MASYVRNLIEISGITDFDDLPVNPTIFKQFCVQEILDIPCAKPDVEQIVKVISEVIITSTRVIQTPVGTSMEGQILTGYKVIVEGELNEKIEYVADNPSQSVHAAHFCVPFSTFIVLPDYEAGDPVTVTAYIEDIYAELLDKRTIFKNVTIFLDAAVLS